VSRAGLAFLACLGLGGCALLSKGEVSLRRYYSLDAERPPPRPPAEPSSLELRLGRVTATASLEQRVMFRESGEEVGFHDDRLWTELPEAFLQRALVRELFEGVGLRRVLRGASPTLDVELLRFEEVRSPAHVARVEVAFTLSDERLVTLQQTLAADRAVDAGTPGTEGADVARAMGEALRQVVSQLASGVRAELASAVKAPAP
jgi:ABC-type uncharacterized transport system auxiliary subunit